MFVVGCPRSGTSVLTQEVEAHPRVGLLHESHLLDQAGPAAAGLHGDPRRVRAMWAAYRDSPHLDKQGFDRATLDELAAAPAPRAMLLVMMRAAAARTGADVLGEKTPSNFRRLQLLLDWFPDGRVLFMVRDPRAVVASTQARWEANLVDGARGWNAAAAAVDVWGQDPRVLVVRYEDLVTDPEVVRCGVFGHLGLDVPPPSCVERVERSYGSIDGGEVTSSQLEVWRQRLSPAQVAEVEQLCRQGMVALGYVPESARSSWTAARAQAGRLGSVARRAAVAARTPRQAVARARSRR